MLMYVASGRGPRMLMITSFNIDHDMGCVCISVDWDLVDVLEKRLGTCHLKESLSAKTP